MNESKQISKKHINTFETGMFLLQNNIPADIDEGINFSNSLIFPSLFLLMYEFQSEQTFNT